MPPVAVPWCAALGDLPQRERGICALPGSASACAMLTSIAMWQPPIAVLPGSRLAVDCTISARRLPLHGDEAVAAFPPPSGA